MNNGNCTVQPQQALHAYNTESDCGNLTMRNMQATTNQISIHICEITEIATYEL